MPLADQLIAVFADDGPLAKHFPGYVRRQGQVEMAVAVARSIDRQSVLLAEAGTGTGKTLAYVVPALLSGKKIVISTATKNLQEQVALRDLPRVSAALGLNIRVQLLKGRQNYLCLYRLARANSQGSLRLSAQADPLTVLTRWAEKTETGDRAEVKSIPDDFPGWRELDARSETCLGQKCSLYDSCFVTRARSAAQQADVVVVNHHLFFADLALRHLSERYDSPVIPDHEVLIFDEAHTLEQVVTEHFGVTFSEGRLQDLVRDVEAVLGQAPIEQGARLRHELEALVQKTASLFQFWSGDQRAQALGTPSPGLVEQAEEVAKELGELARSLDGCGDDAIWTNLAQRVATLRKELSFVLLPTADPSSADYARLFEERARTRAVRALPLAVNHILERTLFEDPRATLLTSATLSIAGDFNALREKMGIVAAEEVVVESPFVYERQALVYVPSRFPEPADPEYAEHLADALVALCQAANGGAFLLFTSLRMMNQQAAVLKRRLQLSVLVQGEAPKSALLERFVAHGSSVLCASHSFWEGVDVPGRALRLVVIDKLPFGSPGDPLLAARIEKSERAGERAFEKHQMPTAILSLRQGFGRLIRSLDDFGVVALMDIRLRRRYYGRRFLQALPPAPVTDDLNRVDRFYREHEESAGSLELPGLLEV